MTREIDAKEALAGTPRPHYLTGKASYRQESDDQHILLGTVNFVSAQNPSVEDRAAKYLPNPHVNVGDVCFAVWNGAHVIGNILGYSERILVNEIRVVPHKIVPADTDLDLEIRVSEGSQRTDRNQRPYALGKVVGQLHKERVLLVEVYADILARR